MNYAMGSPLTDVPKAIAALPGAILLGTVHGWPVFEVLSLEDARKVGAQEYKGDPLADRHYRKVTDQWK